MDNEWDVTELSDAGVRVFDCEHRTPLDAGTGYPYIAIPNIKSGRLDLSTVRKISAADLQEWTKRVTPQAGDIIVTRRGRVGDAAVVPAGLECAIGQNLVILRSQSPKFLQSYLRWVTQGPLWEAEVRRLTNVGAVFESLNVRDITRVKVPLPPVRDQKAIAEVLDALDNKIAVNERVAETSLALAKARMESADLAMPIRLSELADVFDGPHATPQKTVSGPWFLSISSLKGGVLDLAESAHLTEEDFPRWTRRVQPHEGDVLFSYETRLGEAALMPPGVRASLGRRMGLLRPKPGAVRSSLLLHTYLSPPFQEEIRRRTVRGATVDRIPLKEMPTWPITLPAADVREQLSAALEALHASIDQMAVENHTLADLRNTLLPQLVTGKIRVKDAVRVVEDVAS
jgi:type I restriction enzyme, S subunit